MTPAPQPGSPDHVRAVMRELWVELAESTGGHVRRLADLTVAATGLAGPFNPVFVTGSRLVGLADSLDRLATQGVAPGVFVPDELEPECLLAIGALGLVRVVHHEVYSVESARVPAIAVPGLQVREVTGAIDDIVAVDVAAFGDEPEVMRPFFTAELGLASTSLAVGYLDGVPVGCATVRRAPGLGAAGIFGIGVVPEARRRGIGAAMTSWAVRAGGQPLAILHPTDMARSMYRRLGFAPTAGWTVWTSPTP